MAGFIPAIHVFHRVSENQTWMAGTSPAMTEFICAPFTSFCSCGLSKVMQPSKKKMPSLAAGHFLFSERRDD